MSTQTPKTETGAERHALNVPYFRQVPIEAIAAGSASLEHGAEKYTSRNWEKGLPWQQLIDSMRRHLDDFERRVDYDEESGLPTICSVMANAMMLTASYVRKIGDDNRLPATDGKALTAKECALWMQETLNDMENHKIT